MKVLLITNIFLQATQLSTHLKRKEIDSTAISLTSKPDKEIDIAIKEANMIILDLPTNYTKEMIQKIKNTDINKPIIVLGNSDQYKDIVEISKLGIYKYIKKPFDPELLAKYIKEYECREEIQTRNATKGFAMYTRNVNDVMVVNILGYLQPEIIDRLKEIIKKHKKVAISLNGISSMNLNVDVLKNFKELTKIENAVVKFILVREKIKNILLEEGIDESLIFPNEFMAVRSFY